MTSLLLLIMAALPQGEPPIILNDTHIVFVSAEWCVHCQPVKRDLEDLLVKKPKWKRYLIIRDVANYPKLTAIPAFLLIEDGKVIKTHYGPKSVKQLRKFYYDR